MSPLGAAPPAVADSSPIAYMQPWFTEADAEPVAQARSAQGGLLAQFCGQPIPQVGRLDIHIPAPCWLDPAILTGDPAWLKPSSRELEVPGLVVNRNPQLPVRLQSAAVHSISGDHLGAFLAICVHPALADTIFVAGRKRPTD